MHKLQPDTVPGTIVVYGDSGVGKTTLGATAPPPVLFLNRDNGIMSLLHQPRFANVRVEDIKSSADFDRCIANLSGTGQHNWTKFRSIVLDDLPSMQDMVMFELMKRAVDRDERRQLDDASQREYGIMGNRMRRFIRQLKLVPMHKVFVCSMAPDKDSGVLRPGLTGALRYQLAHLTDAVIFMKIVNKDGDRVIYLDGTDEFQAKTRAWWLPKKILVKRDEQRATLTQLFHLIARGPKEA